MQASDRNVPDGVSANDDSVSRTADIPDQCYSCAGNLPVCEWSSPNCPDVRAGYVHAYKHDERDIQEWVTKAANRKPSGKPKKPIQQFDLDMNLIAEYDSAADAARALGKQDKSGICAAARKGRKAYNSYWKYKIDK